MKTMRSGTDCHNEMSSTIIAHQKQLLQFITTAYCTKLTAETQVAFSKYCQRHLRFVYYVWSYPKVCAL